MIEIRKFKQMIDKIILMIRTIIERIKRKFGGTKKRTQGKKRNIGKQTYDNTKWFNKNQQSLSNNVKEDQNSEKDDEKQEISHDYYYMPSTNLMKIIMSCNVSETNSYNYCKTDPNCHINLIRDEDMTCLYPTITIAGQTIKIFVSHAIYLLDENTRNSASQLNPQVYIIPKTKTTIPIINLKKAKITKAMIYTKEIETQMDYIIEAEINTIINAMYLIKGTAKLGTIAMTFIFTDEKQMYWSGSLVIVEARVYIIGTVTRYPDTSAIKLLAYAVGTHSIKIEIDDEE